MTPGKLRRWVEAIRSQESDYAFKEALKPGEVVAAGEGLPTLEVLVSQALPIRELRVHSLHVRAAAAVDDPDGIPVHIMRLVGVIDGDEEIEILREAIVHAADAEQDLVVPTCAACEGRIWDFQQNGQVISIDGHTYHRACVVGGEDDNG